MRPSMHSSRTIDTGTVNQVLPALSLTPKIRHSRPSTSKLGDQDLPKATGMTPRGGWGQSLLPAVCQACSSHVHLRLRGGIRTLASPSRYLDTPRIAHRRLKRVAIPFAKTHGRLAEEHLRGGNILDHHCRRDNHSLPRGQHHSGNERNLPLLLPPRAERRATPLEGQRTREHQHAYNIQAHRVHPYANRSAAPLQGRARMQQRGRRLKRPAVELRAIV
mmetsp:Transcript_9907/g.30366  ORF Transcript_9907/g.30366 Transcript_9907/m.30366 type:complete len:219 (+) Transcript_9907:95-751(+)